MRIRIKSNTAEIIAELRDTATTRALAAVLPCTSEAHTWGDEVYFGVPVAVDLEPDARQVVEPGTVCFWVEGRALALPYGPTPISQGDECRLVARVNLLGRVVGDPKALAGIHAGDSVRVERA